MSLCLTYKVNLGLSLRKTAQALKDIHGICISHQQVANYCKTASVCIKPFVDNYDYNARKIFTADETYIKIRGIKAYIWFIMDAASRSLSWIPHIYGARRWCMHSFDAYGFQTRLQAS